MVRNTSLSRKLKIISAICLELVLLIFAFSLSIRFFAVRADEAETESVITKIELEVNPEYVKSGDYWSKPDALSGFLVNMTPEEIFEGVQLTAFYGEEKRVLELDFSSGEPTIADNNVTLVDYSPKTAVTQSGAQEISLSVQSVGGDTLSANLSVNFEPEINRIVKIEAIYKKSGNLSSYSDLTIEYNFDITVIYNDGSNSVSTAFGDFEINGNLTPTYKDFQQAEQGFDTYSKDVSIIYKPDSTVPACLVSIPDIKFVAPDGVGSISAAGNAVNQTLGSPFDFSQLNIEFKYFGGYVTRMASLKGFEDYCLLQYYTTTDLSEILSSDPADADEKKDNDTIERADLKLSYKAAKIAFNFPYDTMNPYTANGIITNLVVGQAEHAVPVLNTSSITFGENCEKEIIGAEVNKGIQDKYIQVSYVFDEKETILSENNGLTVNSNGNYAIEFPCGGDFEIKFTLVDGETGDYQWASSSFLSWSKYVVSFSVTVNNAPIEIVLDYEAARTYGASEKVPTLTGNIVGSTKTFDIPNGYKLFYFGWGDYTADKSSEVAPTDSCEKAGVSAYYVYATTEQTEKYLAAKSEVVSFVINQAELTATNNINTPPVYTQGAVYKESDLLTSTGLVNNDDPKSVYSTDISTAGYTHAGTYNYSVTIRDHNYKWKGETSDTKAMSFVIARRTLSFSVSVSGFEYSSATANPAPTVTKDDEAHFYAVISKVAYYKASDMDGTGTDAKPKAGVNSLSKNFDEWDAGDYFAYYYTTTDTASGDKDGDYTLPTYAASFTVTKKTIKLEWDKDVFDFVEDGNPQSHPTPRDEGGLFSYVLEFFDEYGNKIADWNLVSQAGDYSVKVVDFTCGSPDISKNNYKLPTDEGIICKSFTIVTKGISKPTLIASDASQNITVTGDTVTVIYRGGGYDFSQFIANYNDNYIVNGTLKLNISVAGGAAVSPKNVDKYTVEITPSGNYKWERYIESETETVIFYLEIDPKVVTLEWKYLVITYGDEHSPTATVSNLCNEDEADVTVKALTESVDLKSVLDAGTYAVKATELSNGNYTLVGASDTEQTFTVKRKEISLPSPGSYTAQFGSDTGIEFTVDALWTTLVNSGNITYDIVGKIPDDWWSGYGAMAGDPTVSGASFAIEEGKYIFKFVNAGEYTVSFTLNGKNYCWSGEEQTEDFGDKIYQKVVDKNITVNRQVLTAPVLGEKRAQDFRTAESIAELFDSAQYSIKYGVVTKSGDDNIEYGEELSDLPLGFNKSESDRGKYYVLLTVNSYNVVWADNNPADNEYGFGYVDGYGTSVYGKDGVKLYLHYAITNSQLNIGAEDVTYVFGKYGTVESDFELAQVLYDIIIINGADSDTAKSEGYRFDVETLIFVSNGAQKTELVNGLPWNAGEYTMTVTVKFDVNGDEKYQELTLSVKLTVSKLLAQIAWSQDSATYNGEVQTPTPSIENLPKKYGVTISSPTFTVSERDNKGVINADKYYIRVSGLSGDNANNFELPESYTEFTISSATVSVSGVSRIGDVYGSFGNSVNIDNTWWKVTSGEFFGNDSLNVTVNICEKNGDEYTVVTQPQVGVVYYIVPKWNAEGVHTSNYSVTWDNTATYSVSPREITVAFVSANATAVYGDEVDLYKESGIYTLSNSLGYNDAIKSIIELTSNANSTANVDTYSIGFTSKNNTNYSVEFDSSWNSSTFEITEADINEEKLDKNIGLYGGTYDNNSYNALTATNASEALKNPSLNPATWYYILKTDGMETAPDADNSAWKEFGNGEDFQVKNAGTYVYYVKVTAPNHKPLVVQDSYTVTVEKKEVQVTVSLTIKYGENSPVNFDGNNGIYKATIGDLSNSAMYTLVGNYDAIDAQTLGITGVFSYSTNYVKGTNGAVGSYDITFVPGTLASTNYRFVDSGAKNTLTVTKAVLTVKMNNQTGKYYEAIKELTYNVTLPASSYEGCEYALIEGDSYDKILSLSTYATSSSVVGGYVITCKVADGYSDIYDCSVTDGTYSITQATNIVLDDFSTANSTKKYNTLDSLKADLSDGMGNAIVYGEHIVTFKEPDSKFGAEDIVIKLHYYDSLNASGKQLGGTYSSVKALFGDVTKLDAGYYVVEFTVAGNDNYTDLAAYWAFRVGKAALNITAENKSEVYGTEISSDSYYTYTCSGLQYDEKLLDVLGVSILPEFFTSAYAAGYKNGSVDSYDIVRNTDVSDHVLKNYAVHFDGATLSITKREVTIKIENKVNTYNLQGNETASTLTFTVTNGTFYDGNDNVIELKTDALKGTDGASTNNADDYAIYAVFRNDSMGESFERNYTVKFSDCYFKTDAIGAITDGTNNNAGKFTINKATLKVTLEGPYHGIGEAKVQSNTYSGLIKYYTATTDLDSVNVTLTYYRYNESTKEYNEVESVIDVGSYKVEATSDNLNYYASYTATTFPIKPATLTVTVSSADGKAAATIEYGTPFPTDGKANDRFGGVRVSYSSNDVSEDILKTLLESDINTNGLMFVCESYNASSTLPNTSVYVNASGIVASNFSVTCSPVTMNVVKRKISLLVTGDFSGQYSGYYYHEEKLQKLFTDNLAEHIVPIDSNDWNGQTSDKLSDFSYRAGLKAVKDVNASGYPFVLTVAHDYYDVTLYTSVQGNNVVWDGSEGADNAPRYYITRAPLTLYAAKKVAESQAADYTVVYGEALSNAIFEAYFDGLLGGDGIDAIKEQISFTGWENYEAWKSGVSATFTITVSTDFTELLPNYTVSDTHINATLRVLPRAVTASTVNQTFTANTSDYNGGASGINHNAVITFADSAQKGYATVISDYSSSLYKPVPALKYRAASANASTAVATAPTTAGDYKVTVSLAQNGNYVFEDGNYEFELDFTVNKRVIQEGEFYWKDYSIKIDSIENPESVAIQYNEIDGYIPDIFDIVSFQFVSAYGGETTVNFAASNSGAANTYYFGSSGIGLYINAKGIGEYRLAFSLKSTATENYELENTESAVTYRSFYITVSGVTLTASINGWIYGDTPNAPVVLVNGTPASSGLEYAYVKVASVGASLPCGIIEQNQAEEYISKSGNSLGSLASMPDAGYYILRVRYSGVNSEGVTVAERVYVVFLVRQKETDAPTFDTSSDAVYTGGMLSVFINYDDDNMRFVAAGIPAQAIGNRITLSVTEANTYSVVFSLRSDNYKWKDGAKVAEDGTVTLRWTVNASEDNNVIMSATYATVYGVAFTPDMTATLGGLRNCEYIAYNGGDYPSEGYTTDVPTQAGKYLIKVTFTAQPNAYGNKNYNDACGYATLVIDKATLTVTASASSIYGNAVIDSVGIISGNVAFDYGNISGFRYNDTEKNIDISVDSLSYVLSSAYVSNKLVAGVHTQAVSLKVDEHGYVIGMSADNYYIRAAAGTFTVSKRPLEITIGACGGVYTSAVNLNGAKDGMRVTGGSLAAGDSLDNLNVTLTTTATADSHVGGYAITASSYDESNYTVVFVASVYTVSPLEITLDIAAKNGVYRGTDATVEIVGITAASTGYDEDKVLEELARLLRFTYGGIANSGEIYSGSAVPTQAGSYTATVVGASSDYSLANLPIVHFTVEKQSIDVSKISVSSVVYDMEAHKPVIIDSVYGSDYYTAADVSFVNASTHNVPLTLIDSYNTKWSDTDGATTNIPFVITKAQNGLVGELKISGWTYGKYDASANMPKAITVFGAENVLYAYSSVKEGSYKDGTYTLNVPASGDAGTYYVIAVVPGNDNYLDFESAPVAFIVSKAMLAAPTLELVSDGENKNDTYTGNDLFAAVSGFDSSLMKITYDGMVNVNGDNVTVYALNAGVYTVKFSLIAPDNYAWATGSSLDADGNALSEWKVNRKKIALPTANTDLFVVNGSELVYLPVGFDSSIMKISGNTTGYGGEFTATVTLADTSNYEWEDGSDGSLEFTWNVVGVNTVFAVTVSAICTLAAVGIAGVIVECALIYKKKKRLDAEEDEEDDLVAGGANA